MPADPPAPPTASLAPAEREALGLRDDLDLDRALGTRRLVDRPGFGPERVRALREELESRPWDTEVRPLARVRRQAVRILERLQREESALRMLPVGAVRRMEPEVRGLELFATAHEPTPLLETFAHLRFLEGVERVAEDVVRARFADGLPVTLEVRAEDPATTIPAVIERTGPRDHVDSLRVRAEAWTGDGVHAAGARLEVFDEAGLYAALAMPYVPPECRHRVPPHRFDGEPVSMSAVRGLAGVHTEADRGAMPLGHAALRSVQEGYAWLLVTDGPCGRDAREARSVEASALERAHSTPAEEGSPARSLRIFHVARWDGRLPTPAGDPLVLDPGREAARLVDLVDLPHLRAVCPPRRAAEGGTAEEVDWAALLPRLRERGVALALPADGGRRMPAPAALDAFLDAGGLLLPMAEAYDLEGIEQMIVAVALARRAIAPPDQVVCTWDAGRLGAWLSGEGPPQ